MAELTVKKKRVQSLYIDKLERPHKQVAFENIIFIKIPKPINKYIPSQDFLSSQAKSIFKVNPKNRLT